MKSISILILAAMAFLSLAGCTDADVANWTTIGSSAEVTCFSGGKVVGHWKSTGKVQSLTHSDGWQFKDAASGRFIRVSGICIVEN